MSAAGRSDVRHEKDAYITPQYCVRRFLEAYQIPSGMILDPCAARGELLSVVRVVRPDCSVMGIEIREECLQDLTRATASEATIGDFLQIADGLPDKSIDCILTNFPFSLAEEFLRASVRIARVVITLQRINWLAGGRDLLMQGLRPGLFVLPERPSFNGWGQDACEYSFFVFGDPAVAGTWTMLGRTPKAERTEWKRKMKAIYPKPKKKRRKAEEEKEAA